LALGEIYRGLAGSPPPPDLKRGNESFFEHALPDAEARARKHLQEAVRFAQEADASGFLAQSLAGLGFLDQAAGQRGAARERFDAARAIAEDLGAQRLIERIDAAP
jgi:hypothetical protein